MTRIVFSKDRPLQLHAFLRSFAHWVEPVGQVDVLWTASDERYAQAYGEVFALFPFAVPRRQADFKADVLDLIPAFGSVVFFVDDQVFTRRWEVEDLPGLSLHLAPHLSYCYTLGKPQRTPSLAPRPDGKREWIWAEGDLDWRYPLSLDGHVFDGYEMRGIVDRIAFTSPNTLEAALQVVQPMFLSRLGICYDLAPVVNVPWNLVQSDYPNRFANGPTAESMLTDWNAGRQINLSAMYGVVNASVHQAFPFETSPR